MFRKLRPREALMFAGLFGLAGCSGLVSCVLLPSLSTLVVTGIGYTLSGVFIIVAVITKPQ